MRTSTLLISVVVHGVAISVALGVGVYASTDPWRPPARIEIQQREASAPASPQVKLLDVVTEEIVDEALLESDLVVEPLQPMAAPAEQAVVVEAVRPERTPTLERVRKSAVAEATNEKPPEPVEPEPQPQPEAPAQARVDARPFADNEPPTYPDAERRRAREGNVVVAVKLDAQGAVQDVSLRKPSRYAAFNREALRAVRKWRFQPATEQGTAVASETDVTVVFRLTD